MTQNTIALNIGHNYLSFPESSTDSFKKIFTDSGIINNIVSFSKFDPILSKFTEINSDYEYIQQGRGYLLVIGNYSSNTTPTPLITNPQITYQGITYINPMNFNTLQSMLFKGYNLVGPDSNTIESPGWCKVIDATTRIPAKQLYPTKAYFVHFDECQISNISGQYSLPLIVSILMVVFYLNLFRKEAKEAELVSKLKEKLRLQSAAKKQ